VSGSASPVRRAVRGLRWYVRELSGESAYDRYVAHARHDHAGAPVLSRRAFERARQDERGRQPQQRCC
jgi:uncharacterized short protein YbdD (DUF466 family)